MVDDLNYQSFSLMTESNCKSSDHSVEADGEPDDADRGFCSPFLSAFPAE